MPFELWNWADTAGAPREIMDQWRHRDIRADIQALCRFPVYLQNDATAACGAELVFGQTGNLRDFIYFYIGAFAGGGVVLNGRLYSGPTGNAGALGSMPVPGADGRPTQLIDVASLAILEKALNARGVDATYLWTSPEDWSGDGAGIRRVVRKPPAQRSPMPSSRRPRSSISRRRSSTAGCRLPRGDGWSTRCSERIATIDVEGLKHSRGPRRHGRHPCPRARRRQPAAVGAFSDRRDRAAERRLRC